MKFIKLLLFSSISSAALAGGFQVNTQSIKGIGLGGAFTGICNDASSAYFNPGAMGMLEKK